MERAPTVPCLELAQTVWPEVQDPEMHAMLFTSSARNLGIRSRDGEEGEAVVDRRQGLAFLALVSDVQSSLGEGDQRYAALDLATEQMYGMKASAFDRGLHELAKVRRGLCPF